MNIIPYDDKELHVTTLCWASNMRLAAYKKTNKSQISQLEL